MRSGHHHSPPPSTVRSILSTEMVAAPLGPKGRTHTHTHTHTHAHTHTHTHTAPPSPGCAEYQAARKSRDSRLFCPRRAWSRCSPPGLPRSSRPPVLELSSGRRLLLTWRQQIDLEGTRSAHLLHSPVRGSVRPGAESGGKGRGPGGSAGLPRCPGNR